MARRKRLKASAVARRAFFFVAGSLFAGLLAIFLPPTLLLPDLAARSRLIDHLRAAGVQSVWGLYLPMARNPATAPITSVRGVR